MTSVKATGNGLTSTIGSSGAFLFADNIGTVPGNPAKASDLLRHYLSRPGRTTSIGNINYLVIPNIDNAETVKVLNTHNTSKVNVALKTEPAFTGLIGTPIGKIAKFFAADNGKTVEGIVFTQNLGHPIMVFTFVQPPACPPAARTLAVLDNLLLPLAPTSQAAAV